MRSLHRSLCLATALLLPHAVVAQTSDRTTECPGTSIATPTDCVAVHRAVLDYVEGFYEGDTTKLVRGIWPEVRKYGYWREQGAERYSGEAMPWSEIIGYAKRVKASGKPAPATAPKRIELFDVQDQTASAKLTAAWGTDYLLLARQNGRWLITHVLWQGPLAAARAGTSP